MHAENFQPSSLGKDLLLHRLTGIGVIAVQRFSNDLAIIEYAAVVIRPIGVIQIGNARDALAVFNEELAGDPADAAVRRPDKRISVLLGKDRYLHIVRHLVKVLGASRLGDEINAHAARGFHIPYLAVIRQPCACPWLLDLWMTGKVGGVGAVRSSGRHSERCGGDRRGGRRRGLHAGRRGGHRRDGRCSCGRNARSARRR